MARKRKNRGKRKRGWKDLVRLADKMRRNPTPAEKAIKDALDRAQVKYVFQYIAEPYILDFYLDFGARGRFDVEVDGASHRSWKGRAHDRRRTQYLEECGVCTVRVANEWALRDADAAVTFICESVGIVPNWFVPPERVEPEGRAIW